MSNDTHTDEAGTEHRSEPTGNRGLIVVLLLFLALLALLIGSQLVLRG